MGGGSFTSTHMQHAKQVHIKLNRWVYVKSTRKRADVEHAKTDRLSDTQKDAPC